LAFINRKKRKTARRSPSIWNAGCRSFACSADLPNRSGPTD
jgi:hypothetical protein